MTHHDNPSLLIADDGPGSGVPLRDVLEDKNRRLESERQDLARQLEEKNAELERYTYCVSHDLKSPLITITGFLGLIEKSARSGDLERLRSDMDRIRSAAEQMHHLLDELLELSRVGRMVSPPEDVPLSDLAREVVELVYSPEDHGDVDIRIDDDLPVFHGDRRRLRQLYWGLIENALGLLGEEPRPVIEIGVRQDDEETVLFVRDNGFGVDPEAQHRVFWLFNKLDGGQQGSGFGLALVKRIIELHGGRIWVESKGVGEGSTFCFTIPTEAF